MIKKWCKKMPQLLNGVKKKTKLRDFFLFYSGKFAWLFKK